MAKEKKIKLKGSSFWDRRKPINKKRKVKVARIASNGISKKGPINKVLKSKQVVRKDNTRSYSNHSKTSSVNRYLPDVIEKRYVFIIVVIILVFMGIGARLFQLQVLEMDTYSEKLVSATEKIVEGESSPRGRIYDRNYKLLVDNEAVKTIYYKKEDGVTTKEEIELAYKLTDMLNIDYSKLSEKMLKTFWYKNNKEEAEAKITKKERQQYNERKLSDDDLDIFNLDRSFETLKGNYNTLGLMCK